MTHGTVKFFSRNKGWGFVNSDEEPERDIFVHYSSIAMDGFKLLRNGDRVSFEAQEGPRGWCATRVVPLAEPVAVSD